VDAELDRKRTAKLLEFLEDKTQTFVTTSKETLVEQFKNRGRVFTVENGIAIVQNEE
jgi:recombinational DNA repair ATPase RecF